MARPKILTYRGDGELRSVNDSDFNGIANLVLEKFASELGPGSLTEVDSGTSTLIGTFTDTSYQGAVGTGDATVLSTTYNLYQDLNSSWTDVATPPVVWGGNSIDVADSDTLDSIADNILSYMVTNEGAGCYQLQTSAPAGGTWQTMATFTDTLNTTTSTTYNLYKKISGDDPVTYRPVKNAGSGSLQVMTEAETQQLEQRVRKRIVQTGVGRYVLQSSAPVTGTWADKGTIIDTRPTTSAANYTTSYAGERDYVGAGDVPYTATFDGAYTATYTGTVPANYAGTREVDFLGTADANFTGFVPGNFLGVTPADYVGDRTVNYAGERPANYAGTRTVSYAGTRTVSYAGTRTSTVPGSFSGAVGSSFSSTVPANFAGQNFQVFTGTTPGSFTNPGFAVFVGSGTAPLPSRLYYGARPATYAGTRPASYAGTRPANFAGTTTVNYVGVRYVSYGGTRTTTVPGNFSGSVPGSFSGSVPGSFAGTAPGSFSGIVPGTFTGTTPANYAGTRSTDYLGVRPANYTGTVPGNFLGVAPVDYSTNYITTYTSDYVGAGEVAYVGPGSSFVDYTGVVINADSTNITTLTLWRRIA